MNFSELKDELFARGSDYLDEDAGGVARAARWLNQAYREILNLQAWPFLESTAAGNEGAGLVDIPDLRKIRFVANTDTGDPGVKLRRASLDDLADEVVDFSQTGSPVWYYVVNGTTVKSYPVGGTLKVYYIKRVDALTADTDEPIFREEYHDLIVDRAMMKVYKDSDNFENLAALKLEYDAGVTSMAEDYQLESREVQFISVDPYDG